MSTENLPFIERDISWLAFNERVLQEAKDRSVPLYERIKFLAIYSSNLDEFFRVRVASIRSFRKLDKPVRREMELKPRKLLRKIRHIVQEQQAEFGRIFRTEILPELADNGIHLVDERQFSPTQHDFALLFFQEKIKPRLRWSWLTEDQSQFLEDKALYLIVSFSGEEDLAVVALPDLERFVVLPAEDRANFIAFLDDVLRVGLPEVFLEKKVEGAYAVKLSRDAELYIDDEFSGDLREKIKAGLEERKVGLPTRFLYDASMPEDVLKQLKACLGLSKNDLIPGARYHNFNDFFAFPNPAGEDTMHDPPMPPLPHPELERAGSFFPLMARQDFLLHFPYQQFDYVLRFIEEAAFDPAVESIKITLYRVASRSAVAEALLRAVQNGKQVTVFVEAKARFDEETNLFWGEQLQQAGATVKYSFPGIKVHTKLLLVSRREMEGSKNYAWLATGNFNEKTARLYSDFGLLTADPRLVDEAAQVFSVLEGKSLLPHTKHLFVAPFNLRERFEQLIQTEIANARNGLAAWMVVKINSLEDPAMMRQLIAASQAGVKIQMIVRGICCLQAGVPGLTENIEMVSIIDRFLEHARVYIFANGGVPKIYLASADWMRRNLDRRVEVAFPVFDEKIRQTIWQIIDFQLHDNVKARWLEVGQTNRYRERMEGEAPVRSQLATYEFLKNS